MFISHFSMHSHDINYYQTYYRIFIFNMLTMTENELTNLN